MTTPEDGDGEPADYSTPKPQPEPPPPPPGYPPYTAPPPYAAPPQPGYSPPPPWAYQVQPRTNGFAIAALICGCAGFVTGCTAPLAVIFGFIARSQIKNTREDGNGMAIAGIVLGILVTAGFVVFLLLAFAFSDAGGPTY